MNGHCLFPVSPPPLPRLFSFRCISSASPSGNHRIRVSGDVAVECHNLCFSVTKRSGISVPILWDCSFRIPTGQLWMILGPNGCGKSTLLKILAGVMNPTSGNVFVEKSKNFVFQNPDHQVVMPTVEADVAFGLGKYHDMNQEEVKSRVIKALDAVGMRDYMQGMGFIAGLLLLYMSEEDAFWLLVALLKGAVHAPMEGLYHAGLPLVQQYLFQLENLVREVIPKLGEHFTQEMINPSMYASQWFITVFSYSFPFPLALRIWDVFLSEGVKIVFKVGLSIVELLPR